MQGDLRTAALALLVLVEACGARSDQSADADVGCQQANGCCPVDGYRCCPDDNSTDTTSGYGCCNDTECHSPQAPYCLGEEVARYACGCYTLFPGQAVRCPDNSACVSTDAVGACQCADGYRFCGNLMLPSCISSDDCCNMPNDCDAGTCGVNGRCS